MFSGRFFPAHFFAPRYFPRQSGAFPELEPNPRGVYAVRRLETRYAVRIRRVT